MILSVTAAARHLGLNTAALLRRVCAGGLQGVPNTPLPIDQPCCQGCPEYGVNGYQPLLIEAVFIPRQSLRFNRSGFAKLYRGPLH